MFDQGGLSLDQAPPVSVVFGLFLFGSFFGLLSALSILYYGSDIFDSSSTGAVVTTHLLALGVMMSFMLGALFQMLPVIAGVVLEAPVARSNLLKALLGMGVLALSMGFITHVDFLFLFATLFLGAALLYIAGMMLFRLGKIAHHSASSRGMLFSLSGLLALVLLALYMTTTYAQMHTGGYFMQVKEIHYSIALYGWMALLIASISFQTVEMFYVTPAYPSLLSRYMPLGVFSILFLFAAAVLLEWHTASTMLRLMLYLILILYALSTLLRLSQRKRPLTDATLWFWRIGMGSLVASMLLLGADVWVTDTLLSDFGSVFFGSFVLSILFAMFYKIVPFLTWFHLNAQGYFTAPMMHEVIHPKTAKKHLWIHIATLFSFLLSILMPPAVYLAGILMLLSFGWVGYQVLHATTLYKHTQETGERFDMTMMGSGMTDS